MKRLARILIVLSSATTAIATTNPQIRACKFFGGEFIAANTAEEQIGLCKFDASLVGSIDILNKDARIEVPLSLYNYKKGIQACTSQNTVTLTTFEGEEISICHYYDGSVIDIETLSTGKNSYRNKKLNAVLGL